MVGSVSTKSDIEHAFASAYLKDDELFLYFGADRYDPTGGTTNVGFWFLPERRGLGGRQRLPRRQPGGEHASPVSTRTATSSSSPSSAAAEATWQYYEWSGGLDLLAHEDLWSFCNGDDSICAQTNDETIPSTWPYSDNQRER